MLFLSSFFDGLCIKERGGGERTVVADRRTEERKMHWGKIHRFLRSIFIFDQLFIAKLGEFVAVLANGTVLVLNWRIQPFRIHEETLQRCTSIIFFLTVRPVSDLRWTPRQSL